MTAKNTTTTAAQNLAADKPLIEALGNRTASYCFFKRALDIVGALALILALSPVLLVTWVLLMVTTKGNPMFIQERIGFLGRRFPMIKFRTMRLDAERVKHLVENTHTDGPIFKNRKDPRITAIGGFLRRTSIDELPQLFNVLMGQMSLVGPRPALIKEVAAYEAWQRRRLGVMPGLTCLWQISGRSEIGFRDWCRMDIWYLSNQNILTDLWLLIKTPTSVLSGRGAY